MLESAAKLASQPVYPLEVQLIFSDPEVLRLAMANRGYGVALQLTGEVLRIEGRRSFHRLNDARVDAKLACRDRQGDFFTVLLLTLSDDTRGYLLINNPIQEPAA